jgi:crotonobetainyl-CoA:carnitine CoA-transferase CaiB-like acyl-CoA transferase
MLGEHNEQVLQELGFDAVDIARIKAAGAFDR